MKNYLEGKYSLAVNFWGFMILGGVIVRGVCGYFSYYYGPTLIIIASVYTFITSYATWNSAKIYKKDHNDDNLWKPLFAQVLAALHIVGGIYLIFLNFR